MNKEKVGIKDILFITLGNQMLLQSFIMGPIVKQSLHVNLDLVFNRYL